MDAIKVAEMVDEYYRIREARLTMQREVNALEESEKALKKFVVNYLRAAGLTAVGGQLAVANLKFHLRPIATDWSSIHNYMKLSNSFDIVQKRLLESAVIARWEENIEIPGIDKLEQYDLTLTEPKS